MVIVLSALSVVAAAVLLGAWFLVGGGFALIYAAMALAVTSMVLLWAARWIGSTPDAVPADGPVELRALAPESSPEVEPTRDLVSVSAGRPEPVPAGERSEADGSDEVHQSDAMGIAAPATADDVGSERDFPIADYDTLWLSQILPLLGDLDDAELAMVDARERGGRHRAAVLDAIAARRPETGGAGAPTVRPEPGAPTVRPEPGAWEQGPGSAPVAPLTHLDLDLDLDETSGSDERSGSEDDPGAAAGGIDPTDDTGIDDTEIFEFDAGEPVVSEALVTEPDVAVPDAEVADPFGLLDPAAQAEEDRLWAAAVPLLDQGRDPFLDDDDDDDGGVPAGVGAGAATGAVHDDWDVAEPDEWDWSGVRPAPVPLRSIEAVDLTADPDIVLLDDGPDPSGGPRVRTFLGRRRSPVTVRRG